MSDGNPDTEGLLEEIESLRSRLNESEETLRAISRGEVDAFVITGESGTRVYTLEGADKAYRTIIETMNEGAVTLSPDGTILYANSLFARMLGQPLELIIGSMLDRFLVPDQKVALDDLMGGPQLNDGVRGEVMFVTSEGEVLPAYVAISPLDLEGAGALCLVVTDLSEQKRLDRQRAEELESTVRERTRDLAMFKRLADSSGEGIAISDNDLRITYANEAYEKLYGYGRGEALGKRIRDFVLPQDVRDDILPEIDRSYREEGAWSGELEVLRKDGKRLAVLVSASVLFDDECNRLGVVGIVRDISDIKRFEDEILKANRELDAYAHTVSHDLRSPLSAIVLANEALRDVLDDDLETLRAEVAEATAVTGRNVGKAFQLVNDLLSLAVSGQKPAKVEDVEVSEVVRKIVQEHAHTIAERGVSMEISPDLGTVRGSEVQVYQIFANLVSNAISHNDSQQPAVSVVLTGAGPGSHTYQVRDNGSGIPSEMMDKLFLPLAKSDRSGRLGIGLPIVKRVLDVYGGEITVRNEGGACFEFTLNDIQS